MSGIDMLLNSLIRLTGITVEDMKATAVKAYQTVLEIDGALKRIEANQAIIMAHLGVVTHDHSEQRTGNGVGIGATDAGGAGDVEPVAGAIPAVVKHH